MEFHGMSWTLFYFHGISVEFCGIQMECHGIPWNAMDVILFPWHFSGNSMASRLNAIECHGMPWNAMKSHGIPLTLHYFHGISVKFHGISVECHGIQWDTEDWYSDKISEWI